MNTPSPQYLYCWNPDECNRGEARLALGPRATGAGSPVLIRASDDWDNADAPRLALRQEELDGLWPFVGHGARPLLLMR